MYCISGYQCHDLLRAKDLLRSHTCSIFDFLKEIYTGKVAMSEWESDIANEAIQVVISCWGNFNISPKGYEWRAILEQAIVQHLGRNLRGFMISSLPHTEIPKEISPGPTATPNPTQRFSDALRSLLDEARWTSEMVAEKVGIDPRNVYRHLSEDTMPTKANVGKYEEVLSKQLNRKVILPTPEKRLQRQ
jgi:hypothetical protein